MKKKVSFSEEVEDNEKKYCTKIINIYDCFTFGNIYRKDDNCLDICNIFEKFKEFSRQFSMNIDIENDKIISGLIFTIGRPIFMESKIVGIKLIESEEDIKEMNEKQLSLFSEFQMYNLFKISSQEIKKHHEEDEDFYNAFIRKNLSKEFGNYVYFEEMYEKFKEFHKKLGTIKKIPSKKLIKANMEEILGALEDNKWINRKLFFDI